MKKVLILEDEEVGYIYQNSAGTEALIETTATQYRTSDYIPVKAGITYRVSFARYLVVFDNTKTLIPEPYINQATYNYEYTPEADGYLRFSYLHAAEEHITVKSIGQSNGYKIKEGFELSNLQMDQVRALVGDYSGNQLTGKKYIAAGDSYTEWSDAAYPPGHIFNSQTVTYDREIRKRCSMTGTNIAVSGTTMALSNNSDPTIDAAAFSNTKYQSVPADTDYLTLAFGINDATYCDVGQQGDTTNDTFWGAWDVVLNWYAENRPEMKIGIIIFQRGDNEFYQAILEIAKYYGIPYIDFYGGEDTPMYVDGKAYTVDSAIKATRKAYFCGHEHLSQTEETFQGVTVLTKVVEANPTHPGYRTHIDESTIIEEFLKRL